MKPILEKRNARMRTISRTLKKEGKTEGQIVDALTEKFKDWNLSFDTIRLIINNLKYGRRKKSST